MNQSSTEPQGGEGKKLQASKQPSRPPSSLSVRLLLVAAVVGGLVGGALGHRFFGVIPRPEMTAKYYKESEERWATLDFSPDVVAELQVKNKIKLERNTALALGLIGAVLGGLFGLAAGVARRAWIPPIIGAVGGTLSGAVLGAAGGFASVQLFTFLSRFQIEASRPSEMADAWLRQMYSTIGVHAVEWCLAGIGVGLAVGLAAAPPRNMARKMAFGGLAGLLAAALYMPLASMVFPNENSNEPFPTGAANRMMFATLAGVAMAILLNASTKDRKTSPSAVPASGPSTEGSIPAKGQPRGDGGIATDKAK